jgi:hypothetical protein
VSASDDGVAYFAPARGLRRSTTDYVVVVDPPVVSPQIKAITPPANAPCGRTRDGPHSAVKVPERDLLVVTRRLRLAVWHRLPVGPFHMVDIKDATAPRLVGEVGLREQHGCSGVARTSSTRRTTPPCCAIALVSWYSAGSGDRHPDPRRHQLGELRPDPIRPWPSKIRASA